MALQTITTIKIGERAINNFCDLKIHQKIHDHHTFSFQVRQDLLVAEFESVMPVSQQLYGAQISIEVRPVENLEDHMITEAPEHYILRFYGVVTAVNIQLSSLKEMEETFLIQGHSNSIVLENGPESNSFTAMTLSEIVNKVKNGYNIDFKVSPVYKEQLSYTVQHNESCFDFLNRLARRHGEWFYDNGQVLVFGNGGRAVPKLVYGTNIQEFNYDIKVQPALFKTIENDNRTGSRITNETLNYRSEIDGFQQNFLNKSNSVFSKQTIIQLNQNAVGGNGSKTGAEYTRNKMRAVMSGFMQVRAISEVPGITVGSEVVIKGVDKQLESTYCVTEIIHDCDDGGGYHNSFTAVNLNGSTISPQTNPDLVPYCLSQTAVVVANADPDGLSAVQVQMPWQEIKGETTPYIPLLQQYGGNDKGAHWIPEIGETVFVDFQGGNAEMPIVTGTFSNTKEKSGYATPDNDIKALHTRSNNRLIMNDKAGSVLLEDSSKSFLDMSGNRKIELNTDELTINVKRIIINATQSTEITTNDYMLNALSRIYILSKTMQQKISGFMNLLSGTALINSRDKIEIEAKVTKLHGSDRALMHSDKEALINSKGTATLQGTQGNNYSNNLLAIETAATDAIALAVVYFRPLKTWTGEFGFDWLREKDNGLALEPDYESIIEGGYKDGDTDLGKEEAYAQLKTEYDTIPITRKTTSPTANTEYFVPYLTLFSKDFVDAMPNSTVVKPEFKANLKVLLDIQEDVEKIEFDYDETLFEVIPKTFVQKTKTKGLEDQKVSIKITCLKDLDSDKEISVYAYPKGTTDKTTMTAIDQRKLAGRIKVLKNDSTVRKEEKFVLVGVNTNFNDKEKDNEKFNTDEKYELYKGLHQALIIPTIEESVLDLSNHPDFQIEGKYVDENRHIAYLNKNDHNYLNTSLHPDVQSIFFDQKDSFGTKNKTKYDGFFTIFKFEVGSNDPNIAGAVQKIAVQNVIIFKSPFGYKDSTLSHEVLHGLGLCHTHRDSDPLHKVNYRYIYPQGKLFTKNGTDNIMSYSHPVFTTWKWQWELINSNIKKK